MVTADSTGSSFYLLVTNEKALIKSTLLSIHRDRHTVHVHRQMAFDGEAVGCWCCSGTNPSEAGPIKVICQSTGK